MRDILARKIMALRSRQNEDRILDLLPGLLLAAISLLGAFFTF